MEILLNRRTGKKKSDFFLLGSTQQLRMGTGRTGTIRKMPDQRSLPFKSTFS